MMKEAILTCFLALGIIGSALAATTSSPSATCGHCNYGGVYVGRNGTYFHSPGYPSQNYPDNCQCSWVFYTDVGKQLYLAFPAFNTELGYDFVFIYSNLGTQNPVPGQRLERCSGLSCPGLLSPGRSLIVNFTSDYSFTTPGFLGKVVQYNGGPISNYSTTSFPSNNTTWQPMNYTTSPQGNSNFTTRLPHMNATTTPGTGSNSSCGQAFYFGSNGTLMSPNYPGNYPTNLDCAYTISVSTTHVRLSFVSFNTEAGYDTLSVYGISDFIGVYSGSGYGGMVLYAASPAQIQFRSDGSVVGSGFRIQYTAVTAQQVCSAAMMNNGTSMQRGQIASPNFGNGYFPDNLQCTYYLTNPAYTGFYLSFDSQSDLGADAGDYVRVAWDGNNAQQIIGKSFSPIRTSGYQTSVTFHSNAQSTSIGFSVSYSANSNQTGCTSTTCQNGGTCMLGNMTNSVYCICPVGFTGKFCQDVSACGCGNTNVRLGNTGNGTLTSPNYPNAYCNLEKCRYSVTAPANKRITASFPYFSTESGFDSLYVFDGNGTANSLEVCSGAVCNAVTSSGNQMTLTFTSDSSGVYGGWVAQFRAV